MKYILLIIISIISIKTSVGQSTDNLNKINSVPCSSYESCNSAKLINIPNSGIETCTEGCNIGMPLKNFGACNQNKSTPTAYYKFYSGLNSMAIIDLSSDDLADPICQIMTGCSTLVACIPNQIMILPFTEYHILVTDRNGQEGNFNLCITLFNFEPPCITDQTLKVTGTNLGSSPEGPFISGEVINLRFSANYLSGGNCQWIHSFVPYLSNCFQNAPPFLITFPEGADATIMNWYSQGATTWKPLINDPTSAIGLDSHGKICIIGTDNCIPLEGGPDYCSNSGSTMPAGWVITSPSGTCNGSTNPNQSWGIPQPCGTIENYTFDFSIKIPESTVPCPDDEKYAIGLAIFNDGATGGWANPQCNGNGFIKLNLWVQDGPCTPPELVLTNGEVCSGEFFNANINTSPVNSLLHWTVSQNSNVTGMYPGSGTQISQKLKNKTNQNQSIIYYISPEGTNGCDGPTEQLSVTIFPEMVNNAPDLNLNCFDTTFIINANVSGGADNDYSYTWSNGISGVDSFTMNYVNDTFVLLSVTDGFGCQFSDSVFISKNSGPAIINNTSDQIINCLNSNIIITANTEGSGDYFYEWSTGESGVDSIVFNFTTDTFITLLISDTFGCEGVDTIYIIKEPSLNVNLPSDTSLIGLSIFFENSIQVFSVDTFLNAVSYVWSLDSLIIGEGIEIQSDSFNVGIHTLCVKGINECNDDQQTICWEILVLPELSTADCAGADTICSKELQQFSYNNELGDQQEWNTDPECDFQTPETNSHWLTFSIEKAGKLWFTIYPETDSSDIDFILYKGTGSCEQKEAIRCSFAGYSPDVESCLGNTGLLPSEDDEIEGPNCDAGQNNFLKALDCEVGDRYFLSINDFGTVEQTFEIDFCGDALMSCDTVVCEVSSNNSLNLINHYKVYPNPNQGIFLLELLLQQKASIEIYDIHGKRVHKQDSEPGASLQQIEVNNLFPSVYNLIVRNKDGLISGINRIAIIRN